ncbi:hypothetical protein M8C21_021822 [Ambrosia artemisiifolia]|uniref:Uncharacterized protein n=1 Tax=Ambrosia artemisiifolia TaxID=4212 RepID=A0AAD5D1W8_AMBAR|nr:hypothetical protein M8C21_021822 [Ambrosia artemisiifolia]
MFSCGSILAHQEECNSGYKKKQVSVIRKDGLLSKKKGLQLPPRFVASVGEKSGRSLKREILSFETFRRLLYPLLKKLDFKLKHEDCHWAAYYVEVTKHRMSWTESHISH